MPEDPNLIVFPFDGGLNTQADDEDVPLGDCVDCLNVIADKPGALRKRPGRIAAGGYAMDDDNEPSVIRRWTPDNGTTYDWVGFFELSATAEICENLTATPQATLKEYSSDLPTDVDIDFMLGALRFAPNNLVHPPQWYGAIDRNYCWLEWDSAFAKDANCFLDARVTWDDFSVSSALTWALSHASSGAPFVLGDKLADVVYYYRFALVYDGAQEGPLTDWQLSTIPDANDSYNYLSLYFADAIDFTFWNPRLTGINIYRASSTSPDYVKVGSVSTLSENTAPGLVYEDADSDAGVWNCWHLYTADYNGGAGGYGTVPSVNGRPLAVIGDNGYYADGGDQESGLPFVVLNDYLGEGLRFEAGDFVWRQEVPLITYTVANLRITHTRFQSWDVSLTRPTFYYAIGAGSGNDECGDFDYSVGTKTLQSIFNPDHETPAHGAGCLKYVGDGSNPIVVEWEKVWGALPAIGANDRIRIFFKYKIVSGASDAVNLRVFINNNGSPAYTADSATVGVGEVYQCDDLTTDEWQQHGIDDSMTAGGGTWDPANDAALGYEIDTHSANVDLTAAGTGIMNLALHFTSADVTDLTVYLDCLCIWITDNTYTPIEDHHFMIEASCCGGDRVATHTDWDLGGFDSKRDWIWACGSDGNNIGDKQIKFVFANTAESILMHQDYLASERPVGVAPGFGVGRQMTGFLHQYYQWDLPLANDVRLRFYDVALADGVAHPFGIAAKLTVHYKCSTWLNGRLFTGNVRLDPSGEAEDHPDWIIFSAFESPDVLPVINYIEVPELLGSEIIDLTVHLGELIVLTNRGVYRLHVPAGDPTAWDMVEAHPTANLVAFRASAVAENEFFFFAGVEAVYALTPNFEFRKLTDPIKDDYQAITTKANTQMHYDSKRGLLYCWFGEASAEVKVFDVNAFRDGGRKVWRPWKLPHSTIDEAKVLFAGDENFETHIINYGDLV